jgi:hypothetical protein
VEKLSGVPLWISYQKNAENFERRELDICYIICPGGGTQTDFFMSTFFVSIKVISRLIFDKPNQFPEHFGIHKRQCEFPNRDRQQNSC